MSASLALGSWHRAPAHGMVNCLMQPFPPPAADAVLPAPSGGDFFASRPWFATLAAHALPPGSMAEAQQAEGVWLMLRREGRRLSSLTGPYSQGWAPLGAPGADWRAAGRRLGALWRGQPPGLFEMLDPAAPGLDDFLAGLGTAGLVPLRYRHAGHWRESWTERLRFDAYLASRPSLLRNTLRRRLARAERLLALDIATTPGPALEAAIAAFEAVRRRSWKPAEPFPGFDAALMRAAAAEGVLRLGILRRRADGAPIAAQYWILDQGGRRALLPKLFHDDAARAESPGTVLTALMIRHILTEGDIRMLDFGRGDDDYKRMWVGCRLQRIGVLLADPRHPAGALAILRHAAGALRRRLSPG